MLSGAVSGRTGRGPENGRVWERRLSRVAHLVVPRSRDSPRRRRAIRRERHDAVHRRRARRGPMARPFSRGTRRRVGRRAWGGRRRVRQQHHAVRASGADRAPPRRGLQQPERPPGVLRGAPPPRRPAARGCEPGRLPRRAPRAPRRRWPRRGSGPASPAARPRRPGNGRPGSSPAYRQTAADRGRGQGAARSGRRTSLPCSPPDISRAGAVPAASPRRCLRARPPRRGDRVDGNADTPGRLRLLQRAGAADRRQAGRSLGARVPASRDH